MAEGRDPAYKALAPMLPVSDVARAIRFYTSIGFTVGNTHGPADGDPDWAWLYNNGAHLMVNRAEEAVEVDHGGPSLWLYTKDVATAREELQARGLEVSELEYPFYNPGGEFHVHDPDGYAVYIAHAD